MIYKLRDYQEECYKCALSELERHRSTLIVMATGLGKTVVFASIARDWPTGRVLVIAHRDELIRQAADKIEAITQEPCAIEMGEQWSDEEQNFYGRCRVIVSSVQTMCRPNRQKRFNPNDFGLIVIDEAHRTTANSYLKILGYFRENPNVKVIGVTATPDRSDKEGLGKVFESVAYEYGIKQGIKSGWLVPIEQQIVWIESLDFSMCRTTAGDLNLGDLSQIMENEKPLHGIADATIKIAGDRKTLIFNASVAQSDRVAEIINRHKPNSAEFLCGETEREYRRDAVKRYAKGEFQFLSNCGIALEGFDDPGIQVVSMARPTKSRALYTQAIGRGTRPLPGLVDGIPTAKGRRDAIAASAKPTLLVVDFMGNCGRHKLIHSHNVLGEKYSQKQLDECLDEIMERSGRGLSTEIGAAFKSAEERRAAARKQKEEEKRRREEAAKVAAMERAEQYRRRQILGHATYNSDKVDAFSSFAVAPGREPGWQKGRKPSVKMLEALRKMGVSEGDLDSLSFGGASGMLTEATRRRKENLCTFKQSKLLKRYGYDGESTFAEARVIIDKLAASGWKMPEIAKPAKQKALPALDPNERDRIEWSGKVETNVVADPSILAPWENEFEPHVWAV